MLVRVTLGCGGISSLVRLHVISRDSVTELDRVPDVSAAELLYELVSARPLIGSVYLLKVTDAELAVPEQKLLFLCDRSLGEDCFRMDGFTCLIGSV